MFSRNLGILAMTVGFLSVVGTADAQPSTISRFPVPTIPGRPFGAPELDPSALASGIVMIVGGVLIFNERRRAKK